jgi:hypothetical protein
MTCDQGVICQSRTRDCTTMRRRLGAACCGVSCSVLMLVLALALKRTGVLTARILAARTTDWHYLRLMSRASRVTLQTEARVPLTWRMVRVSVSGVLRANHSAETPPWTCHVYCAFSAYIFCNSSNSFSCLCCLFSQPQRGHSSCRPTTSLRDALGSRKHPVYPFRPLSLDRVVFL